MRKIIYLGFLFSLVIFSCNKNTNKKYTSRMIGYIYNSVDGMPFTNTQFKLYYHRPSSGLNKEILEEEYFYTDSKGYFDVSTTMTYIAITWPAYYDGAAYVGPPAFDNTKSSAQDEKNKVKTYYQDTLYTTPFH